VPQNHFRIYFSYLILGFDRLEIYGIAKSTLKEESFLGMVSGIGIRLPVIIRFSRAQSGHLAWLYLVCHAKQSTGCIEGPVINSFKHIVICKTLSKN
jgi:hypothetical protein